MNKYYQKIQKRAGLLAAICGSLLVVPAIAMPRMEPDKLLSQTNPSPSIFNEAPYNRQQPTSPPNPSTVPSSPPTTDGITPPAPEQLPSDPGSVTQPPTPEQRQPPSATVMLMNGRVSIRLVNETGADITYQVIGDTNQRSLQGKSNVMLQDLSPPVSVTFKRDDGGLLTVSPQASSEPGMLEVTFTETTDLNTDKTSMSVQETGAVFLN